MIYLLALLLPPLALLIEGHVFHAILNAVVWVILFVISFVVSVFTLGLSFGALLLCSLHAIVVIAQGRRRREHRELVEATRQGRVRT
jgi:hypothetical protein